MRASNGVFLSSIAAGLIGQAREALTCTKLMVLIRPRGGDFVYTQDEIAVSAHFLHCICAARSNAAMHMNNKWHNMSTHNNHFMAVGLR
jgi:copper homeostasis protein CutC